MVPGVRGMVRAPGDQGVGTRRSFGLDEPGEVEVVLPYPFSLISGRRSLACFLR